MARLITAAEKLMRDNIAEEFVTLNGTTVTLYVLDRYDSITGNEAAILYGEPSVVEDFDMTAYYNVKVFFQKPDTDLSTAEGGLVESKLVEINIPKGFLDREEIPVPKKGDVIHHLTFGYYDINKVSKDGYYSDMDESHFIAYLLECERNERFNPSRKLV